jgi:hypothetical protein
MHMLRGSLVASVGRPCVQIEADRRDRQIPQATKGAPEASGVPQRGPCLAQHRLLTPTLIKHTPVPIQYVRSHSIVGFGSESWRGHFSRHDISIEAGSGFIC